MVYRSYDLTWYCFRSRDSWKTEPTNGSTIELPAGFTAEVNLTRQTIHIAEDFCMVCTEMVRIISETAREREREQRREGGREREREGEGEGRGGEEERGRKGGREKNNYIVLRQSRNVVCILLRYLSSTDKKTHSVVQQFQRR